ncbi:uncharacterized protein [Leptinotarsa decemlineata]|uniref:uncharacterized protein n=1 Tax=Leptinotarsa decemlineata TaxID=7539 RepID=UPI003D30919F
MFRIAVVFVYFLLITSQDTINDDCMKHVKDALDRVNHSFVVPSNFSFPSPFNEINELLKRLNALLKNIGNFDELRKNQKSIETNILDANQTDQLKRGIELLKLIYNNLEIVKTSRNKANQTCQTARDEYNMMMNEIDDIEKQGFSVSESISDISTEFNKIKKRSQSVKSALHDLKVPEVTATKYLCGKLLDGTIQEIIITARRIKKQLIQEKEQVLLKLKDLKEKIGIFKEPNDVPQSILKGGDENTVKKLQQEVVYLKNRINKFKQMKEPILKWEKVISNLERRLKEDIQRAKAVKNILLQRDKSKQSYEEIGKIVKGLCERGVCSIKGPVDVEQ